MARCAVYNSRGEAAALRLGLPLPQVYSRLYRHSNLLSHFSTYTEIGIGTRPEQTSYQR